MYSSSLRSRRLAPANLSGISFRFTRGALHYQPVLFYHPLSLFLPAQVQTCWHIGRHIVEFEQLGARRAVYGKQLLATLAKVLTAEFGKGFDETNLRKMRLFYQAFPIRDALRLELGWTHYRRLLRVDNHKAREWYMDEAANQNWSSRALER